MKVSFDGYQYCVVAGTVVAYGDTVDLAMRQAGREIAAGASLAKPARGPHRSAPIGQLLAGGGRCYGKKPSAADRMHGRKYPVNARYSTTQLHLAKS